MSFRIVKSPFSLCKCILGLTFCNAYILESTRVWLCFYDEDTDSTDLLLFDAAGIPISVNRNGTIAMGGGNGTGSRTEGCGVCGYSTTTG
jgi:hypothetical protein